MNLERKHLTRNIKVHSSYMSILPFTTVTTCLLDFKAVRFPAGHIVPHFSNIFLTLVAGPSTSTNSYQQTNQLVIPEAQQQHQSMNISNNSNNLINSNSNYGIYGNSSSATAAATTSSQAKPRPMQKVINNINVLTILRLIQN